MNPESSSTEYLSLAGSLRRRVAVHSLLTGVDRDHELVIAASAVDQVDAVAGAALRLRVERHLHARPAASVILMPPTHAQVRRQLIDLISPTPASVTIMGPRDIEHGRYALLPATPIADHHAAVSAAEFALDRCDDARISEVRGNLVATAVAEATVNSLQHATDSEHPPVVAVTVSGRERTVEVAVVDLGRGISEADSPVDILRVVPRPRGSGGALADLIRRGSKRQVDVSVEMFAGTAHLQWGWAQHRTVRQAYSPGTTVVIRIPA